MAFLKSMTLLCMALTCWCVAQDYDPSKELFAPDIISDIPGNLVILQNSRGQEFRGLWVDAWNKGVASSAQVKETVQMATRYGYNAIVLQVRRRGDALYIPTAPNTEPRISNFDVLAEYIQQAHSANIELHAWMTTFLVCTSSPSTSPQHVYNKHREFFMENSQGSTQIGEGHYLDPGHPGALQWNENVVIDLVKHYNIDGIHFDYVRYPQADSGYNPTAIQRFNQEYGLSGKPSPSDAKFSEWRRRQITDWLRIMYAKIMAIKPNMKVSVATFAGRNDAYHNRFQDWAKWMYEGLVDANFPMNYSTNMTTYQTRVQDALQYSYGRHVYMGVGAYLLSSADTVQQLQYARNSGSTGLILFSYANNCTNPASAWQSTYQQIQQQVLSSPAAIPDMPWKLSPKHGHLYGIVTAKGSTNSIYNANVKVEGSGYGKNVFSSSNGEYSLLHIPNGECTVTVECAGFQTWKSKATIASGKVTTLHIALTKGAVSTVTVDNPNASFQGSWILASSATNKYGADYRYIGKTNGSAKAVFALPAGLDGKYRVYAWYPEGTNRTTVAKYMVQHATGISTVTINQQQNGGKWNLLGTWTFNPQVSQNVTLAESSQDGKVAIADAIHLEKE